MFQNNIKSVTTTGTLFWPENSNHFIPSNFVKIKIMSPYDILTDVII